MTRRQGFAILDRVLRLNAALLLEEPEVFATPASDGRVRIGYKRGFSKYTNPSLPRIYPSMDAAIAAGWVSLERAWAVHLNRRDLGT